jgi:hypothetical protein
MSVDRARLLTIATRHKPNATPYDNGKQIIENPQGIVADAIDPYIDEIVNILQLTGRYFPKFGWISPNSELSEHVDSKTQCSINFLVSEDLAPIVFEGTEYYYTQALLNVQRPHKVINGPVERVMLRIMVIDETYESIVNRLSLLGLTS